MYPVSWHTVGNLTTNAHKFPHTSAPPSPGHYRRDDDSSGLLIGAFVFDNLDKAAW